MHLYTGFRKEESLQSAVECRENNETMSFMGNKTGK